MQELGALDVFVAGRPRTKGSMKPIVNWATQKVHMEEQVKESKPWRIRMVNEVMKRIASECGVAMSPEGWALAGLPWVGPVSVGLEFVFPREVRDVAVWPIAIRYGDSDKLTRNVLDALTDAKVYGDDSQVVALNVIKWFVDERAGETGGRVPGVTITVARVESAGFAG